MIFLCVWYDRHSDDDYAAFTKLEDAIAWCNEKAKTYGGEYEFHPPDWEWKSYCEYRIVSGEEGPDFMVKKVSLDGDEK